VKTLLKSKALQALKQAGQKVGGEAGISAFEYIAVMIGLVIVVFAAGKSLHLGGSQAAAAGSTAAPHASHHISTGHIIAYALIGFGGAAALIVFARALRERLYRPTRSHG
jgi:hypothetical protein